MTARDIVELLRVKHAEDLFVPECKNGPTWTGHHRRLDVWVMKKSWSSFNTIGYEIKVSRSDFLGDQKMTEYIPLCNDFFVVCPPGVIKYESELPPEAGWLQVTGTGNRLITKKRAQHRQIEDPIMLYRYILMCRTHITGESAGREEDQAAYWARWLEKKEVNASLGYRVSKALAKEIHKYAETVQEENERLKARIEVLQEVEQKIKDLGLDPKAPKWSLFRHLEYYKEGSTQEYLGNIHGAINCLQSLEKALKGEK